ncbi:DNA-binding transcriptional regulator, MerR family [Limimonas halophila]|uniref:DNA-binding transcriptional regulator, MerR family n=1 Tax=Limimonas halophila TaxID=1082479 RepID=A0A1G7QHS4_9PROT|nr:MerR family DNA-binding transcriptional regulator [Limimonas halophila]SDF98117.1 DNA-binding transcriptional regulator, MerR family [Limimonas halophila]
MADSAPTPDGEPDSSKKRSFTIGELAREFDVTPRTIRLYEKQGLLAPERDGQRRIYSRRDRVRLKLTLRGRRIGMTLAEIREVFDLYDSSANGEERQLQRYLDILEEKRDALLRQRADIDAALAELEESASACREVLSARKGEKQANSARNTTLRPSVNPR